MVKSPIVELCTALLIHAFSSDSGINGFTPYFVYEQPQTVIPVTGWRGSCKSRTFGGPQFLLPGEDGMDEITQNLKKKNVRFAE